MLRRVYSGVDIGDGLYSSTEGDGIGLFGNSWGCFFGSLYLYKRITRISMTFHTDINIIIVIVANCKKLCGSASMSIKINCVKFDIFMNTCDRKLKKVAKKTLKNII